MIRIHRCKLTINGSSALSDGSTISLDRIKKILAKHLAALEAIPGRVHIKNVTLDLGEFQPLSINPEFIQRFEETCSDLGEKLKELHAIERAKSENAHLTDEDQIVKDELIGALYDLDQTKGIQNALYLVESEQSIQSILTWSAFQKRYAFFFKTRLNSRESNQIQELLHRLNKDADAKIEMSSVKADLLKKGKKGTFSTREIDFILARMETISLDANWMNAMEKAFFKEFNRAITPELSAQLKQVYESFEFSLVRSVQSKARRFQKSASVQADLLQFLAANQPKAQLDDLMEVIKSTRNLDDKQWFYILLRAYKREYDREMPASDQKLLLHFNAWKSTKSWIDVPQARRSVFLTKLKKHTAHHNNVRPRKNTHEFSARAYQFLLDQLERIELNASWFAKITRAYQQEFNAELPRFVTDLLHQFSNEISKGIGSKPIKFSSRDSKSWIQAAIVYFRNDSNSEEFIELLEKFDRIKPKQASQWNIAFENFVRVQTGDTIDSAHFDAFRRFETHYRMEISRMHFDQNKMELNRMLTDAIAKNQSTQRVSKEQWDLQKALLLDVMSEIRLDAAWLTTLKRQFHQFTSVDLPKVFQVTMERFMKKYVWSELNDLPNFTNPSKPVLISVESVRNVLTEVHDWNGATDLLRLLPQDADPQKFVEVEALFDGFESAYSQKIPDRLKLELLKINERGAKWKVQVNAAIERFSGSDDERNFLLISLNSANSFHAWQTQIDADFTAQFSRMLPLNFKQSLRKIEEEIELIPANENGFHPSNRPTGFIFHGKPSTSQTHNRVEVLLREHEKINAQKGNDAQNRTREAQLNFILDFLESHGIRAGWRTKIESEFTREFSMNIPKDVQNLLDEVGASSSHSIENEPTATRFSIDTWPLETTKFLELLSISDDFGWFERLRHFMLSSVEQQAFWSLQELISRFEMNADESIPVAVQMNLRDMLRIDQQTHIDETKQQFTKLIHEELERAVQARREHGFIQAMIEKIPFDAHWLTLVRKQYAREFGKKMSKESEARISDFIERAQRELDRLDEQSVASSDEGPTFFEELKEYLNIHIDASTAERMHLLLDKISDRVSATWLSDLESAYTAEYAEELPRRVQEIVLDFSAQHSVISWDAVPAEKRNVFLDNLRPALARHESKRTQKGNSTADFAAIYAWMLALLESTPVTTAWYSTISKTYFEEFNQNLPKELDALLLDFSRGLFSPMDVAQPVENQKIETITNRQEIITQHSVISWDAIPAEKRNDFLDNLRPALARHESKRTKKGNSTADFAAIYAWMLALLESTPITANWYSTILKAYFEEFNQKLPKELDALLLDFSRGLFSPKNAAQHVENQIIDTIPNRLENIDQDSIISWDAVPAERRNVFLDNLRPKLARHESKPTQKGNSTADFAAIYAWMLALLESTPITANWYSTILKAYFEEFKQNLPKELDALLLDFSRGLFSPKDATQPVENQKIDRTKKRLENIDQDSIISWDAVPAEKRNVFLDNLRPKLARHESKPTKKGNATADFAAIYAWMLALLESTPITANWYSTILKAYFEEFKQNLPKELDALLLDFSRGLFSPKNAAQPVENQKIETITNRQEIITEHSIISWDAVPAEKRNVFLDNLRPALARHESKRTKKGNSTADFAAIYAWMLALLESTPITTNWYSTISKAYFEEFNQNLPKELDALLLDFSRGLLSPKDATQHVENQKIDTTKKRPENIDQDSVISWDAVPAEKRNVFLDNLRPKLARHESKRTKKGNSTADFAAIYAWMLALLESTPITANWYSTISKAYFEEFNQNLPKELDALLLDFSRGLYSIIDSIQGPEEAETVVDLTTDSFNSQLEIEARSTSDLLKRYVLGLIKKILHSEKYEDIENWFTSMSFSEIENWYDLLRIRYEKELGEMPLEVRTVLQHFNTSLEQLEGKVAPESNFALFQDRINKRYASSTESTSDEAGLILKWITNNNVSQESLREFELDFTQKFGSALDLEIAVLLSALSFEIEKNAQKDGLKRLATEQNDGVFPLKNKTDVSELQQKWIIAKVEQMVVGCLSMDDFHEQYRAFFGSTIPSHLAEISQIALDQAKVTRDSNGNILEEIRRFLRKKEMDGSVMSLLSFLGEPLICSQSNWFKVILETYLAQFGKAMPLALQHHLLAFAAQRTSNSPAHEQAEFNEKLAQRNAQIEKNWHGFLMDKLSASTHSNFRLLENQLYFVETFLKSTRFTSAELELLQLDFERNFGERMLDEWSAHLFKSLNFGSEVELLNTVEKPEVRSSTVQEELMTYLGSLEKSTDVQRLLSMINTQKSELDTHWFQTFLADYLDKNHVKMPYGMQAILLQFMRHRSINRDNSTENDSVVETNELSSARATATKTLTSFFEGPQHETRVDPRSVTEIVEQIWQENSENWLLDFASEFRSSHKRRLPLELIEALSSLSDETINLETTVERSAVNETKRVSMKIRLLQFLQATPTLASTELVKLISAQKVLHSESWYETLGDQFTERYGVSMSESDQHALLKFAANDEFVVSELERRARMKSRTEIVSKMVNDYFTKQSTAQQKANRILYFLEETNENDRGLTDSLKVEMQRMYQTEFSEELPKSALALVETCLEKESLNACIARLETELMEQFSTSQMEQNTLSRKRHESIRKPLTNKAKLLQLKEKLEALKKGKKVEDLPLIPNAGIVLGWVFWKSVFTQFDWLEEGKFKELDGIHSSILAANWLHFSVGEVETVNPLILAICDLSEERYEQLSKEEIEAKMNGNELETSITHFYETILSMWPIFEIGQHSELIELFISREGVLSESPIGRRLKMVKEPFDHLLTIHPIPWPISIINFSWTSLIIEVVWD